MELSHVSFSEIHLYSKCQFWHHIEYTLENKQPDSIHLLFGSSVHAAIDKTLKTEFKFSWISMGKQIYSWIKKNPIYKFINKEGKLVEQELDPKEWTKQSFKIYHEIFNWLNNKFPNYKLIDSEMELYEPISEIQDFNFKGFIDLVIQDEQGNYHIVDFKTCSWGWDRDKRSDTKKQYQISLYKKFFCQKLNIDPKKVETHFILLKRTPAVNSSAVELLTISSGPKKLQNANEWLIKQTKGIKLGLKLKNRVSCKYCPWNHTSLCP